MLIPHLTACIFYQKLPLLIPPTSRLTLVRLRRNGVKHCVNYQDKANETTHNFLRAFISNECWVHEITSTGLFLHISNICSRHERRFLLDVCTRRRDNIQLSPENLDLLNKHIHLTDEVTVAALHLLVSYHPHTHTHTTGCALGLALEPASALIVVTIKTTQLQQQLSQRNGMECQLKPYHQHVLNF